MFDTNKKLFGIDLLQAIHWYQQSASQGYQRAIDALERLSFKIFQIYTDIS